MVKLAIDSSSLSSRLIDFLRFLSALFVFLYHFGYPVPGYPFVMVFFVLSGYCVGLTVMKNMQNGRWSWREYLIKRGVRLYIVLIPALLFTYGWARMKGIFFGAENVPLETLSFQVFLGNVMFSQTILVDLYGLNGPLWSLTYEFWYYLLFPCFVLLVMEKRKAKKGLYGLIAILIACFVGWHIFSYFAVWLLGAWLVFLKPITIKHQFVKILVFLSSVGLSVACIWGLYPFFDVQPSWKGPSWVIDMGIGVATMVLLYIVVSLFNDQKAGRSWRFAPLLAGMSYTLYLTHYPLMYVWREWEKTMMDVSVIKVVFVMATFGYACILARLTEHYTPSVTKRFLLWNKAFLQSQKRKQ